MSQKESNALKAHNTMFSKQAVKLVDITLGYERAVGIARFKVVYADGKVKFDFECGSSASQIQKELI